MSREGRDLHRELTPAEADRLSRARAAASGEFREHVEFRERQRVAVREPTISGQLRRAIADSRMLYPEIAHRTGVSAEQIFAFMAGERALDSESFDKLAALLNLELVAAAAAS